MIWVDEARRKAFEGKVQSDKNVAGKSGDLERLLPDQIVQRSIAIGKELLLPYEDAVRAIGIASEHSIAVLGFDAGEIGNDGLQVVDYSGYDFPFIGHWNDYVVAMNARAEDWIKTHQYGHNHGYLLTATSEHEFRELGRGIE